MLVNLISTASSVVEMIYPHSPGNESFCDATREPAEAGRGQARSSRPRSRSPCAARPHPPCPHHRLGRRGGRQTASLGGPSSATPLLPSLRIDSALEPRPLPVHVPRGPRLLDEPQTGCSSPHPVCWRLTSSSSFATTCLVTVCIIGVTSTAGRAPSVARDGRLRVAHARCSGCAGGSGPGGRAGAGRWGARWKRAGSADTEERHQVPNGHSV